MTYLNQGNNSHNSSIYEDVERLLRSIMEYRQKEGLPPLRTRNYLNIFNLHPETEHIADYKMALCYILKGYTPDTEVILDLRTGYFMKYCPESSNTS